jgi:hypothetical protein
VALVVTGVQPTLPQTTAATCKRAVAAVAVSDAGIDAGVDATAVAIIVSVNRPPDKTAAANAGIRILFVVFTGNPSKACV